MCRRRSPSVSRLELTGRTGLDGAPRPGVLDVGSRVRVEVLAQQEQSFAWGERATELGGGVQSEPSYRDCAAENLSEAGFDDPCVCDGRGPNAQCPKANSLPLVELRAPAPPCQLSFGARGLTAGCLISQFCAKGGRLGAFLLGLLAAAGASAGSVTYVYDGLGRLKSATYADGTTIVYALDGTGNRQTVTSTATAGSIQLVATTVSTTENAGSVILTVARAGGSAGQVQVSYATSNGTATAGADYTATSGQLTWATGVAGNQTITVPLLDDTTYEGNEAFTVALSAPTGGALLGAATLAAVTIVENDSPAAGTIAFAPTTYTVGEGTTTVSVTATRTGGSTGAVTVDYATSDWTANAGGDYTAKSGQLSWASGVTTSQSIPISIINDAVGESTETFNVSLSNPSGGAAIGAAPAVVLITDNETGTAQFTLSARTVTENSGSVVIDVARTGGSTGPATVAYATSSGSALGGGVDYQDVSGTLSWVAGEDGIKSFSVPIVDGCDDHEPTEFFTVALSSPAGLTLGNPSFQTINIDDNDAEIGSTIAISPTAYSVLEGVTSVTVSVSRNGFATGTLSVQYLASGGTATAGQDFQSASGTLNWSNGESGIKTFQVNILDDSVGESPETINLALSNAAPGGTLSGGGTGTVTINDNEPGELAFSASGYSVIEGTAALTFTVQRQNGSYGAIGVSYATANGTAVSGSDYTSTSGSLTWTSGDSAAKQFSVPIANDGVYENATENFTVALSSPTGGATLGIPNTATGSIVDDDGPSVPSGLISSPIGNQPSYTILWTASAVGPVNHYTLSEEQTEGPGSPSTSIYTVTPPATSKAFSKGGAAEKFFIYKVRACGTVDESFCSAWSNTFGKSTCPVSGCP